MENEHKKTCHIVGAADFAAQRFAPASCDLVIACDAGLRALEKLGRKPDIILGDFDSLGETPKGDNVLLHPVKKDDTDSYLALVYGLEHGYDRFILHGCTGGGRFDHTLSNLQTLSHSAENGADAWLFDRGYTAFVLRGGRLDFEPRTGTVSVFAWGGEARGVFERGLEYTLENAVLTPERPVGVSNSFIGKAASIGVTGGALLVVWEYKKGDGLPGSVRF